MTNGNGSAPKVLLVDLSIGYGGSTSRVLSLLKRSQPGSMALACLEGASVTEHAREMGLPLHIVGRSKLDPSIPFKLVSLIRRENFTLLDTQNVQSKFWANFAAMVTKTTLVSTVHSWYLDEHGTDSWKGKIYTGLEVFTNRSLDLYITVSKRDREQLLASNIPEDDIVLVYNAVDINGAEVPADPAWLRREYGLPQDAVVCTAVGRLVNAKNHHVLVSAVKQAIQEVPELVCLIIGTGDLRQELEAQIRELGLEKHVKLLGYLERTQVLKTIKSSDVYVMPSRYEGTPIALLEAAALGRPILSTYAGGVPELVSDQEHALLVDSTDVDGMAQALVKLCCDREFAEALGERGRQHVEEVFSVQKQLETTWQAYHQAMERHQVHRYLYWD